MFMVSSTSLRLKYNANKQGMLRTSNVYFLHNCVIPTAYILYLIVYLYALITSRLARLLCSKIL